MFATQQAPIVSSRKRGRDAEEDLASMGFGEHRNKRLHSLPVRPSLKQWTSSAAFPSSQITPANSDTEDAAPYQQPQSHFSVWTSSPTTTQQPSSQVELDTDMDMSMDMDDAPPMVPPPVMSTASSGRLPTPMQASFGAQVRGSSWGAGPGPALNHINGVISMPHEHTARGLGAVMDEEVMMMNMVPRAMEVDTEWHNVQNRRLPSPISEADDRSPSISGMCMRSPDMVLDAGFAGSRPTWTGMQRGDSTWATGSPGSDSLPLDHHHLGHITQHRNDCHSAAAQSNDFESSRPQLRLTTTQMPESANGQTMDSPSPGRKGHARSRHTVNTWSMQPGMTKSFSIGYRADCEKCRNKVPGHFNHIIVS